MFPGIGPVRFVRSAGFEPATGNLRIISAHLFISPIRGIPGWDGVYQLHPRPHFVPRAGIEPAPHYGTTF